VVPVYGGRPRFGGFIGLRDRPHSAGPQTGGRGSGSLAGEAYRARKRLSPGDMIMKISGPPGLFTRDYTRPSNWRNRDARIPGTRTGTVGGKLAQPRPACHLPDRSQRRSRARPRPVRMEHEPDLRGPARPQPLRDRPAQRVLRRSGRDLERHRPLAGRPRQSPARPADPGEEGPARHPPGRHQRQDPQGHRQRPHPLRPHRAPGEGHRRPVAGHVEVPVHLRAREDPVGAPPPLRLPARDQPSRRRPAHRRPARAAQPGRALGAAPETLPSAYG
jgi:hypothetical protein